VAAVSVIVGRKMSRSETGVFGRPVKYGCHVVEEVSR
jgi:hypothetical protein